MFASELIRFEHIDEYREGQNAGVCPVWENADALFPFYDSIFLSVQKVKVKFFP